MGHVVADAASCLLSSFALVPRDHSLIPLRRLEPEASGLLGRLLNVLNEDMRYNYLPALLQTWVVEKAAESVRDLLLQMSVN